MGAELGFFWWGIGGFGEEKELEFNHKNERIGFQPHLGESHAQYKQITY